MIKSELVGKIQTVLGMIEGEELGVTLMHEHLLVDSKSNFIEPAAASDKAMAHKPVDWDTLSWIHYHPFQNIDNMELLDEKVAISEAMLFKEAGGGTIVDLTVNGIGRDPKALARISWATGLNIIMGSGYYQWKSHPPEMSLKSEEEITEEIVRDITIGVDDTGIRSGIIGEIGCDWPLRDNERKVLRAAARAQQRTGACLNIHAGHKHEAPFEIYELLDGAGADISRVIFSHIDSRITDHKERCKLLKTGCTMMYDAFGFEGHFPETHTSDVLDLPNDTQRIYDFIHLIDEGYLNQILVSHDICTKARLVCYGGIGYAHISNYVVSMMLKRGMTHEQINTIMVENPKRLLCFV